MRGIVVGLVVLGAIGCNSGSPPAGPTPADADGKPGAPKAGARPGESRTSTFEQAWAEATELSRKLDDQEPKRTAEAIRRLGVSDQAEAGELVSFARDYGSDWSADLRSSLQGYGLTDLLQRNRREVAFGRANAAMRTACQAVWRAGVEPNEYLLAADWFALEDGAATESALDSLARNEYPSRAEALHVIERLPGGADWLKARQK